MPDPVAMTPSECTPADECLCLAGEEIDELNKSILACETKAAKVAVYEKMANDLKAASQKCDETRWYQAPEIIVSGVIVSLSLGALLGWFAGHR